MSLTKAQLSAETDSVIFQNSSKLISAPATNKLFKDIIDFIPTGGSLTGSPTEVVYFGNNGNSTSDSYFTRTANSFLAKSDTSPTTICSTESSSGLTILSFLSGVDVVGSVNDVLDISSGSYACCVAGKTSGETHPFAQMLTVDNIGDGANVRLAFDPNEAHGWQVGASAESSISNLKSLYTISAGDTKAQAEMEVFKTVDGDKANIKVDFSSSTMYCSGTGGTGGMYVQVRKSDIQLGNLFTPGNGTIITINDLTQLIKITNVPAYADDAAAVTGGLTTGNLYKTTVLGSTFLKIVP